MAIENEKDMLQVAVYGLVSEHNFHVARIAAEALQQQHPNKFHEPKITELLEFDWNNFLVEKKKEIKGEFWGFSEDTVIFINEELLGSTEVFVKWATENFEYEDFRPLPVYEAMANEAYRAQFEKVNRDFVYMNILINEQPAGRLVFELYSDICPKTCKNFLELCSSSQQRQDSTVLTYKNSLIHRIVKNGWLQGGDIVDGSGSHSESIYGPIFEDENFSVHHDRRGILGMSNKGMHSNGSQFYVTLSPAKWMDAKYVAFGRLVEGTKILSTLEEQPTYNERPKYFCRIGDCGVYKAE